VHRVIGRERRRLERAFRMAMVAAVGPAVMMACDASNLGVDLIEGGAPGATSPVLDATLPPASADSGKTDAGSPPSDAASDAKPDSPPSKIFDAGFIDAFQQGGCYIGAQDLDSSVGVEGAAPGQDTCAYYFGCGLPQGITNVGCNAYEVMIDGGLVPLFGEACWIGDEAGCDEASAPVQAGAITLFCNPCFGGGGRRPAGLVRDRAACGRSRVGAYLAALAFEEDASVTAFERMRAELATIGAPQELVIAASRAARDEVRHARVMTGLAQDRTGRVTRARVRRAKTRDALALAAENAAEGCVRETFGALLTKWQAAHARDGELRRVFTTIARDEARHAALSWALARWIEAKLDAKGRARVARVRARAVRSLAVGIDEPDASLACDAGLPTASQSRALLAAMTRELALTTDVRR
jgi:hypothetical protein